MTAQRVAIVGCGRMGATRARACAALGVEVALLIDADPAAAEALAAECAGSRVLGQAQPGAFTGLDAVFVCAPPGARADATTAVIADEVPTFFEKPVGVSAGQAAPTAEALDRRSIRNAVGFHNRYRRSVRDARAELQADRPFAVVAHWVGPAYAKSWWLDESVSGGPINDQAIHLVDLCRYIVGEIADVSVQTRVAETGGKLDTVGVALRFLNDACGVLLYSHLASTKQISLDAFTPSTTVSLEGWEFRRAQPDQDDEDVFVEETAAFLGLRGEIRSTFADAMRTQQVMDSIRAAAGVVGNQ